MLHVSKPARLALSIGKGHASFMWSPKYLFGAVLLMFSHAELRADELERAGRDWWSLQPVVRPSIPAIDEGLRSNNPIDAFALEGLRKAKLEPSPPARASTLARRVAVDLLGLPPTPEERESFDQDSSANAYERQLDRYLASPHYGERWARHWLDLARFGESQGFERDHLRTTSWRYRDGVVDAFNRDLREVA